MKMVASLQVTVLEVVTTDHELISKVYIYIYIYYFAMVTASLYIAYTPYQYST